MFLFVCLLSWWCCVYEKVHLILFKILLLAHCRTAGSFSKVGSPKFVRCLFGSGSSPRVLFSSSSFSPFPRSWHGEDEARLHNDLTAHPPYPPSSLVSSLSPLLLFETDNLWDYSSLQMLFHMILCWPIALIYDIPLTGYRTHGAHHTIRWIVWHMLLS